MKISHALWIAALAVGSAGCGEEQLSDSSTEPRITADQDVTRDVTQAHGQTIPPGDLEAIALFSDLPARWNLVAAPLVRDYLDPNVSAERWVTEASTSIGELRAIQAEMLATVFALNDPGIKKTYLELATNYRTKLDCVTALHNAVARGDQDAEQRAQEALSRATAEGQQLAQMFLDRLRPYVEPEHLSRELNKRGKEIGQLMKPQRLEQQ